MRLLRLVGLVFSIAVLLTCLALIALKVLILCLVALAALLLIHIIVENSDFES